MFLTNFLFRVLSFYGADCRLEKRRGTASAWPRDGFGDGSFQEPYLTASVSEPKLEPEP